MHVVSLAQCQTCCSFLTEVILLVEKIVVRVASPPYHCQPSVCSRTMTAFNSFTSRLVFFHSPRLSLPLSLSLSLSLTHTHTHKHTHARTHARTHAHTHTHGRRHTSTHERARAHRHILALTPDKIRFMAHCAILKFLFLLFSRR